MRKSGNKHAMFEENSPHTSCVIIQCTGYNILTRESKNDFGDGRVTNMRLDGKRNTSVEHPL